MSILLKKHYGNSRLTAGQILRDPVLFLAFGFGSGLLRKMPGTFGTLAAVPLYAALIQFGDATYLVVTLLGMGFGIAICDRAAEKLQEHDYGGIVWDEIVGFLITMIGLPFSWQTLLGGFALFRLFDIVKPWPIGWLDRHVHGGMGIMLDDIVAGVLAAITLRLIV
ncbi:MAG: phosphatidylglycerophosphatase A [Methylomonas sp.]|nr:phosphatidylglycerophosphatase A [Methylomonas sp.]PPD22076.1 MAG: phosphatidylglycerophosphatase A [Methylomonas sp.]PPD26145.1 MAG: phosphatidylglycerophosphatase A [Methylomonas sp.]PPD37860.1 MAG: phosphatidylglycerophosphatase A [Methylomonas sp.]PPD42437.1 MAG: phosphatidylglycerophosphatase A [Methylomonas sp.]